MTSNSTATKQEKPGLNPRRKEFCRLVHAGLPAAEAYREAGFSPTGANGAASRLLATVSISDEIARLGAITLRSGVEMRKFVTDGLTDLAESADTDSAKIRALELLGKTERMFIEVSEQTVTHDVTELQGYSLDQLTAMLNAAQSEPEPIVTTARMIESGDGVTA